MLHPDEDEHQLAEELRATSPSATPKALMISYADHLLGRNGWMVSAIQAIGRGEDADEGAPFVLSGAVTSSISPVTDCLDFKKTT